MLMTNGIGATVGTLSAGAVVNSLTYEVGAHRVGDWQTAWLIFAGYALVVGILFFILFKKPKGDEPLLG